MNVDVMVNGGPWKVAIEPDATPGRLSITIKGKSRVVDASWIDADTLSLLDAGTVREVRLHARAGNGAVGVETGGHLFEVVVSRDARPKSRAVDSMATGATSAMASAGLGRSQAIKAPMPGRVVRVLVGVGDRVAARQPVVVVEAMKMENELRATAGGRVKAIHASPGQAVEKGTVLVELE